MLQITFNNDGRVGIFDYQRDASLNVTADINKLPALVPAATLEEVRNRMAAFLDMTEPVRQLKAVR